MKRLLRWLFPLHCCACGLQTRKIENPGWQWRPVWMNNGFFVGASWVCRCPKHTSWPRGYDYRDKPESHDPPVDPFDSSGGGHG